MAINKNTVRPQDNSDICEIPAFPLGNIFLKHISLVPSSGGTAKSLLQVSHGV